MADNFNSSDKIVLLGAAGLFVFALTKIFSKKVTKTVTTTGEVVVTYEGYDITPPSNWTQEQQEDYIDVMVAYTDAYLKNSYYMDSPESAAGQETAQIMAAQKALVALDLSQVPYIEGFDYMAVFGQNYPGK